MQDNNPTNPNQPVIGGEQMAQNMEAQPTIATPAQPTEPVQPTMPTEAAPSAPTMPESVAEAPTVEQPTEMAAEPAQPAMEMQPEMNTEPAMNTQPEMGAAAPKKKKGSAKALAIILGVMIVLCGAGFAVWYFMMGPGSANNNKPTPAPVVKEDDEDGGGSETGGSISKDFFVSDETKTVSELEMPEANNDYAANAYYLVFLHDDKENVNGLEMYLEYESTATAKKYLSVVEDDLEEDETAATVSRNGNYLVISYDSADYEGLKVEDIEMVLTAIEAELTGQEVEEAEDEDEGTETKTETEATETTTTETRTSTKSTKEATTKK